MQAKLGGMGSELELTERERARQSAVLESAVQELSQNVTSQTCGTLQALKGLQTGLSKSTGLEQPYLSS